MASEPDVVPEAVRAWWEKFYPNAPMNVIIAKLPAYQKMLFGLDTVCRGDKSRSILAVRHGNSLLLPAPGLQFVDCMSSDCRDSDGNRPFVCLEKENNCWRQR